METGISQSKRKLWVLVNYGALILLLVMFYLGARSGFNPTLWAVGGFAVILLVLSFVKVYARTRLWRFVHTNASKLDEREMGVTYESLRVSYGAFAVVCLAIFLVSELARERFLGGFEVSLMPIIVALIYLAHTLPASVVAWTEREIYRE